MARPIQGSRLKQGTPGLWICGLILVAAAVFTIGAVARLPPLVRAIEEYHAAQRCPNVAGADCVSSRVAVVVRPQAEPGANRYLTVSLDGVERRIVPQSSDPSLVGLRAGVPVGLRSWRGSTVELVIGSSAIRLAEHPYAVLSEAVAVVAIGLLVLLLTAGITYCVWHVARNSRAPRDADARAGSYSIPYVVQITGAREAVLLLALVGVASLALALWVHRLAGIGALAVILFGYALLWVVSRYRVTLDEETFTYRQFLREHVIRYADIASVGHDVVATGAAGGVLVLLRLGFVDQRKPLAMQVTVVPGLERAIIVHRLLQKATKASFSPDLHLLWTGAF